LIKLIKLQLFSAEKRGFGGKASVFTTTRKKKQYQDLQKSDEPG
jgi:hypothetical protein